jgi:hypothetical protein
LRLEIHYVVRGIRWLPLALRETLEDVPPELGDYLRLEELAADAIQKTVLERVALDPRVVGARGGTAVFVATAPIASGIDHDKVSTTFGHTGAVSRIGV